MSNYPDDIRRFDWHPASPFYTPPPCEICRENSDECGCCLTCNNTADECECYCDQCNELLEDCVCEE